MRRASSRVAAKEPAASAAMMVTSITSISPHCEITLPPRSITTVRSASVFFKKSPRTPSSVATSSMVRTGIAFMREVASLLAGVARPESRSAVAPPGAVLCAVLFCAQTSGREHNSVDAAQRQLPGGVVNHLTGHRVELKLGHEPFDHERIQR